MTATGFPVWSQETFDVEVLEQPGLALVDFWTEGCVPCRQLARVLGELAAEISSGLRIGTVTVEDNPALVERFGIRSAPTLLLFKDGVLVATRTGVDRRQVLKKLVEAHI